MKKETIIKKKGLAGFLLILQIDLQKLDKSKKLKEFISGLDEGNISYILLDSSTAVRREMLQQIYKEFNIIGNDMVLWLIDDSTVQNPILRPSIQDEGLTANIEAFFASYNIKYDIAPKVQGVKGVNELFIICKVLNYVKYFMPFIRWIGWYDKYCIKR